MNCSKSFLKETVRYSIPNLIIQFLLLKSVKYIRNFK